jgi:hypothetical protein
LSKHIGYRIVDEYGPGYICRPAGSKSTLSLRELIALMEHAWEGGSIIFPILNNLEGESSTREELAAFITVTSDFYPELERYYRGLTSAWVDGAGRRAPADVRLAPRPIPNTPPDFGCR